MKIWIRKMISVLAVCAMVIGLGVPVRTQAAQPDTDTYVQQLIAYYRDDQEDAETDIARVLSEMAEVDAQQAEAWTQIMDYWSYVNTDMPVNLNVAPDGLAQDDSLCIVILGFALNSDGTMKDELIGRLETGLASAEKYPNAYVVVTGGGTAAGNPNVTEGGLMGEWLLEHGLDEERLIVEDQAPDTVGNAENTYRILSEQYPSVKDLVMVTSDYHVPRGSILFYSKCLLSAYESGGEPLQVIANAGYETGSQGYESIALQASGVASVAGVSVSSERLPLSQLSGLTITQDEIYEAGQPLQLQVTARYDTGFSRDVSDAITISGFDPAQGSDQEITVSYSENDITIDAQFSLSEKSQSFASAAYLEKRIEEIEQMDLSVYTDSSVNTLQEALAQAKETAAQADADAEQIRQAYDALNEAYAALIKRVNIAYHMDTEANCNDADAYKINDGVINTGNYWQSVENGQNVASADAQIIIDLDGLYDVDSIVVYPYWGGQRIYKYELYGSTDGAVFIMPLDISTVDYWTLLRFTGLTVDYQNVQEEESLRPAIHDMLADRAVRLGYKYNSFTVSFESINYRFQRDIVYQHILEGYDNDWSKPSAEGKASYTKVSPGTYLFKVRSLRRSDGKTISESTLEVKVSQPWWNSWWAWTIYLFIIGFVFYFILRYKSNQLQKKYDEDKIRFFIDTAHDIRTPVTLIMAPLEDLNREQDLSDKARYYLNLAHESTRKLHSLITQLLEFEKVDAHKPSSSSVPLCLNEVLLKEVSVFRSFCEKKQLTLNLTQPDESVFVSADKHLIEMLLDNLLSNACKYTMPQGEISLDLKATKRKAILSLKDNGIGIPKKAKKHIFSDIYRAENARQSQEEGTGFGLLQVQRIVKMLHGKITFCSEEGKGTTFIVTLPRTTTVAEPVSHESSLEHLAGTSDNNSHETDKIKDPDDRNTLLIVEDHETLRHYLRQTFEHLYRVIDVADGHEAIACLANEYPDIILSDVMMPGIRGDELCRMVKENPDTSGIPVVLLTAKANHEAIVEGLKKGADDYIPKPFSTEILKLKVQGLIDNRNRQRQFFMRQAIAQVEAGGKRDDNESNENN